MANGAETAPANEDTAAPLSLKARLSAIMADCDDIQKSNIQKEKDGKKWTERGHIVEAILSEWRPLLTKHGVVMTPNLVDRTYTGNRCDVTVDFIFERVDDSDQTRTVRWAGCGTDNGDKAVAKAGTNALKEMIKKTFLVTDRDDAKEETESVEHQSEDNLSRREVERLKEERAANLQQWATVFKAALTSAQTAQDVQRLQRDNKVQLMSNDLPEVTRTFFIELIEKRKRELIAVDPIKPAAELTDEDMSF